MEIMGEREELEVEISKRLRDLRKKRNLTLEEFETLSKGAIKSVVIGSYERGTRAISLAKLVQLAEIYQVPIEYFFEDISMDSAKRDGKLIFDLRRIRGRSDFEPSLQRLPLFLSQICSKRRDWNGEVLSLRDSDSEVIQLITGLASDDLLNTLILNGLIFNKS